MKEVASIMISSDQDKFIKTRLSRISDRSTTVETVSQSSFILQKSCSYSGPHPVSLQIWNSDKPRHSQFKSDPLYRFPILNDPRSIYRVADSWILISKEDCTFIDEVDIKSTLKNLQAISPFKRGNYDEIINDIQLFAIDETFAEETKKVNQELFSDQFSNESATPTKKIGIKLPKKEDMWKINNFDQEIIQYNPHTTPASSIEFYSGTNIVQTIENTIDLTNDFENPKKIIDPRSSISSISSGSNLYQSEEFQKDFNESDFDLKRKNNVISSISEEDCYQISSSEEADMSNNLPSHMAELLPENSEEMSKNLFNSRYALSGLKINPATLRSSCSSSNGSTISADEGSIHITNRVFLQDCGATKQVMKGMCFQPTIFAKIPPKNLTNSDLRLSGQEISFGQETENIEFPDNFSPLYKKIVICELDEDDRYKRLEIVSSCTCAGFLSVPQLEFTNIEGKSKAFISFQSEKPQVLTSLLAPEILGSFISTPVSWITCGFEHCCLVTALGSVMSWGYGASGCLGHGNTNSYIFPTLITDLANKTIVYMESGAYHNAAISSEGELFVWGRGDVNQLGIGTRALSKDELGYVALRPLRNDYFFKNDIKVKGIACGEAHTLVLDSSGAVYSFGWAEFGQLGLPLNEVKNSSMANTCKKILALKNQKIIKIGAGSIFSAALSEYGQLFTWGNGEQGQLGLGNNIKSSQFPVTVDILDEFIIDFICGEYNVICLSESKKLYGWGQGVAGIFQNMQESYPVGSELICYVPRLLAEVEIAHRFIISKRSYYPKLHQKGFLSQSLLDDSDSIV
ncbi:unnamed protein product [Blepharisma stoltei]|uniref:Uncharacterized protein n=1 Tax=Blepharisma stoltei TaxID=1481888 RepID=A0AAU9IEV9_9CILI|nr:unnamed protein product [Blepharisma stoltei]